MVEFITSGIIRQQKPFKSILYRDSVPICSKTDENQLKFDEPHILEVGTPIMVRIYGAKIFFYRFIKLGTISIDNCSFIGDNVKCVTVCHLLKERNG